MYFHLFDLLDLLHEEDSRVRLGEVDEVSLLETKPVLGRYAPPVLKILLGFGILY